MKSVVAVFTMWLVLLNAFALIATNRLNLNPDTAYEWINPEYTHQVQTWDLASLHSRWDSYWYNDIAQNGYQYKGDKQLSNIAFFPLYPIIVKSVASLFALSFPLSGWIMSSLFTLLSCLYLYLLVREFHKDIDPLKPVLLLLIFPTAFFLNAVYTESLFLFASIAAFYHTRKKHYVVAGIFGFISAITRLTGILLLLPLLVEYLEHQRKAWLYPKLLFLLCIPLGTGLYFLYLHVTFGDFTVFFDVQRQWGRGFAFSEEVFSLSTRPAIINFLIDAGITLFAFVVSIWIALKLRLSYAVYIIASLVIILSSGSLMSLGRYVLVLFPLYILVAGQKNTLAYESWKFGSTLLLALYTILFVNHYWAG